MTDWAAIGEATRHDAAARVPFRIDGQAVGSVARSNLPALAAHPSLVWATEAGVDLLVPAPERDDAFEHLNRWLREAGLIVAWRDEPYPVVALPGLAVLARFERAASRFWGTLTFGAHATGYVADGEGRPTALWIAQRSLTKPTDPGMFDNLIGGGVPDGQTPLQTLVREGWEEAGLLPPQLEAAEPGRVIRLLRDIPEGLQHEWLHAYDLALPEGTAPANQDSEVAGFRLLPVPDALALAASVAMTVDAALVTLDFALRHGLLPPAQRAELAAAAAPLWVDQHPAHP